MSVNKQLPLKKEGQVCRTNSQIVTNAKLHIQTICYAIVHSHEREGSQRQHTECPNYGTLLRAVAAIFYEGLRHRHD